jgi:hypothetical protein
MKVQNGLFQQENHVSHMLSKRQSVLRRSGLTGILPCQSQQLLKEKVQQKMRYIYFRGQKIEI